MGVWDAQTGQETRTLKAHTSGVWSVAFSPDGKRIASASGMFKAGEVRGWDAQTVQVWDALTGQEMLTLQGHSGYVYSVAFSPDGKRLVSGNTDYDQNTGKG